MSVRDLWAHRMIRIKPQEESRNGGFVVISHHPNAWEDSERALVYGDGIEFLRIRPYDAFDRLSSQMQFYIIEYKNNI